MTLKDWKDKIGGHDAIFFGAVGWPAKIPDHISLWGWLIRPTLLRLTPEWRERLLASSRFAEQKPRGSPVGLFVCRTDELCPWMLAARPPWPASRSTS
jgi:hypothetical protein